MFNLLFSHDFYISTTFLLLYTSFPPVAEYRQGSMHGDLREGTLVLPGFLGGNPGVLVPLLEYLSVGFFHVTPVVVFTTMFSFIPSFFCTLIAGLNM